MGDWREQAACAEVDPELFFPVAWSGPSCAQQVAAAKRVCAGCRVRVECLDWAVTALPEGIAGGLTPAERRGRNTDVQMAAYDVPPGTQGERAAAGRAAIRAGQTAVQVAAQFGVSERTATRWAAAVRAEQVRDTAGSRARGRGVA